MNAGNMSKVALKNQLKFEQFIALLCVILCLTFFGCGRSEASDVRVDEHACGELTYLDSSYAEKINQLMKVPEVLLWSKHVEENGRHVAMNPVGHGTSFHDGQCFLEISLYEDTDAQLLRWRTYQLAVDKELVFQIDLGNPERLIPFQILKK